MSFSKVLIFFLLVVFFSCKKHKALPELGLGNDLNPDSGVQYTQIDSFRIIGGSLLKTYPGVRTDLLNPMGITAKKILVFKNGNAAATTTATPGQFFYDNVVSGQKMIFQFSIIDSQNRESKKSISYTIQIP
jgi:hypothetical protein